MRELYVWKFSSGNDTTEICATEEQYYVGGMGAAAAGHSWRLVSQTPISEEDAYELHGYREYME